MIIFGVAILALDFDWEAFADILRADKDDEEDYDFFFGETEDDEDDSDYSVD
jgi:hypothetical protein